ncbi:MAG TPA: orotate phosphoribosyltransferase [Actinomycetota bacterium]|nr:orotate phosphoribosyltransferase [Actinomycetota bacterium]
MNSSEVLALLERQDAVRRGHFVLSSGLHSDTYVQCAQVLQWTGTAERFGHELGLRLAETRPSVVLGPAMGGIVIGHEVARQLGVRMIFSERVAGAMKLRRDFSVERGERVLIVEDVVTTGGSQVEVIELVRAAGGEVAGVGTIVDRSAGVPFDVPFESLVAMEAPRWQPDECPLCAGGEPMSSPGSRRVGQAAG